MEWWSPSMKMKVALLPIYAGNPRRQRLCFLHSHKDICCWSNAAVIFLSLYHFKKMPWTAYSALGTSFPLTGLSVLLLNQDSAKTNCNGDGRGRCGDWGRVWFTLVYCGPRMSLLPWSRANANTGEKERVTSLPLFSFIPQAPSLAYFKRKCHW